MNKDIKIPPYGEVVISKMLVTIPVTSFFSVASDVLKSLQNKKPVKLTIKVMTTVNLGWTQLPYESNDEITLKKITISGSRKKEISKAAGNTITCSPVADGNNATIRSNANVYHTVDFIPKVVNETLYQTKELANLLKANNTYETCKNIWHFVYEHINYKKRC